MGFSFRCVRNGRSLQITVGDDVMPTQAKQEAKTPKLST